MKKMIFILLLISPALFGQTYYISPSGNDVTGDGSSGSPWRSLYRATSEVTTAGSTIFVREGTYTETSQSQLAAQVNIEGTGAGSIITSTTLTDKPIIRASSAIEGGIGNQTISNLYFDGADTTAFSAIYVVARSNVTIHHCTFVNFLRNGVIFAGRITSSSQFPPDVYSENNKFHHNIMLNCSHDRAGVWSIYLASGALTISGQKDMIVEYNIIDNTTSTRNGYGINTLPPSMGYGNNMGLKIRNNTIKVNKAYRTGSITQWDFAIELWTNKGGIEITNNEISGGVDLAGFGTDDTGGYGFAAKILNNNITWDTPSSHETVAIILESGLLGGITIMGNYIKNYSTGIAFNQLPTNPPIPGNHIAEDVLIAYNVFDDIKRADAEDSYLTEFLNLEEKAYYTNIYFQNNTVFGTTSNGGTMNGFFAWNSVASEIKKEFTNLRVENNIFSGYRRPISIQNQIIDGITVRNNISYNNTYDAYSFAGSDIINDNIENAIATNPLFVDAGAANFQLQSGSPAINAGIDVGLGKDFRGWSIVGLPDIGAYEYGATAPAVGGMLIDASGVLLRSVEGTLMRFEGVVEGVDTPEPDPDPEPEEPEEPEVFQRLGVAAQSVDHGSEEMFVKVDLCSDVEWVATSSEEWLKVGTQRYWKVASGAYVTFLYSGLAVDIGAFEYLDVMVAGHDSAFLYLIAEENTGEERTAIVTITSDEVEGVSQIAVTQAAGAIVSREGILERRLYVNRHTRELVVRNE